MILNLARWLAGAALACALGWPALAAQNTGGCGDRVIAPAVVSYNAVAADDGLLLSPANALGPAAGWGAASLGVSLPDPSSLGAKPWTVCGTSDNNRAVIFTAPALAAAAAPTLSQTTGGSLVARTYYVAVTLVNLAGETVPSADTTFAAGVNNRLVVATPASSGNATGWNLYVGTAANNKTKQNASPLALGTKWTEPLGGLIVGATPPAVNTAPSAYIIDGGRVLQSYLVGGSNFQTATLSADGANFRVVSASTETRLHNGATTGYPARTIFPGGPGYQTTQHDNGYVITSGATAGGLAVTLPPTTDIAAGWTIRLTRDATRDMTVQVNGASPGSIVFPGRSVTAITLAPYNYEFLELQYDGAVYRVISIAPATAGLIGVAGAFAHVASNAELKAHPGIPGAMVFRDGFYAAGDGGDATYRWAAANCAVPDDGAQVQPSGAAGCWVADVPAEGLDVRVWGVDAVNASDSTAPLQRGVTWATVNAKCIVLPAGSIYFADTIVAFPHPFWCLRGNGAGNSTLVYNGTATNKNLLQFGEIGNQTSVQVHISGFRIKSNTKMGAGSALFIAGFMDATVDDVIIDGDFLYNGNIWTGITLVDVNNIYVSRFDVSGAGNDGIQCYSPTGASIDAWLVNGRVAHNKNAAIRQGGGCALDVDTTGVLLNSYGIGADNSLSTSPNHQLYLHDGIQVDSNDHDGVFINNTVPVTDGQYLLKGWHSNNGRAFDGHGNINILACPGCEITIDANPIQLGFAYGIQVSGTQPLLLTVRGDIYHNNGWGIYCTAITGVYVFNPPHDNGSPTGGLLSVHPNCIQEQINVAKAPPGRAAAAAGATPKTTPIMTGTSIRYTPKFSGELDASFEGQATNPIQYAQCSFEIRWGTGATPAAGDPVSGNVAFPGQTVTIVQANFNSGFSLRRYLSGLTPGTDYWIALAQYPDQDGPCDVLNDYAFVHDMK